mmetsp:Transcript_62365/g.193497  ORF Transcript_62365/g.193497 Transcript_62365/m.193497 type:complete len:233 (-) Transcript_62365:1690-2388(-)
MAPLRNCELAGTRRQARNLSIQSVRMHALDRCNVQSHGHGMRSSPQARGCPQDTTCMPSGCTWQQACIEASIARPVQIPIRAAGKRPFSWQFHARQKLRITACWHVPGSARHAEGDHLLLSKLRCPPPTELSTPEGPVELRRPRCSSRRWPLLRIRDLEVDLQGCGGWARIRLCKPGWLHARPLREGAQGCRQGRQRCPRFASTGRHGAGPFSSRQCADRCDPRWWPLLLRC